MTESASCRMRLRTLGSLQLGSWALETSGKRPVAAHRAALDMSRQFRGSRANPYSGEGLAMAASAFAITASARSIAARNSSLFQLSTEWPSSNELSVASCARETNSRRAEMASESSWASASFREDGVISLSLSHRNYGPSGSIVTTVAAVTPLLDNKQGEHAAVDGRRTLPWREAPLFVERAGAP